MGENKRFVYPILAAVIGSFVVMQYIWSQFYPYLMSDFGLDTRAPVVMGATWRGLGNMVLGPVIAGFLVDRFGPKITFSLAALFTLTASIMLYYMSGLSSWALASLWYYAGSFLSGLAGGFYAGTAPVTAARWNPDRIGKAVGIANIGPGLAAIWMAPFCTIMINHYGVGSTYLWFGIIACATFLLGGVAFWKSPPENWKPKNWTPPTKSSYDDSEIVSAIGLLKDYRFWIIWTIIFCKCLAGAIFSMNASLIYIDGLVTRGGEDYEYVLVFFIPFITAVVAVFNAVGRPIWGWIMDKIANPFKTLIVLSATQIGTYLFLFFGYTAVPTLIVADCLFNFANAGSASINSAICPVVFGIKKTGKVMGMMFTATGAAWIIGPYFAAYVSDLVGGYGPILLSMTGLIVIDLFLAYILLVLSKRRLLDKNA